jgi:NAD(P)-dependent dehydrogenase (short-subunit alcohol dehydrogenase family)
MDLELAGKVVVITGGSDGLGLGLARTLLREGARVAVCGRDSGRLGEAESVLRQSGGEVLTIQADVSHLDDLDRLITTTYDRWGRLDGLVNNAGTSAARPFMSVTDAEWLQDLELKLFAALRSSRLAHAYLAASGTGSIVNVLNIGAKAPRSRSMPTSVSRAAGMAFTKALSKEWGPDGIRVNAVLIGLIESGQWVRRAQIQGVSTAELYARMVKETDIPLGRVGRAEEFADLAAFLLSMRSGYITGCAINLDGGTSPAV